MILVNLSFIVKLAAVFTSLHSYHLQQIKDINLIWSCAVASLRLMISVLKQGLKVFTVKINDFFR